MVPKADLHSKVLLCFHKVVVAYMCTRLSCIFVCLGETVLSGQLDFIQVDVHPSEQYKSVMEHTSKPIVLCQFTVGGPKG